MPPLLLFSAPPIVFDVSERLDLDVSERVDFRRIRISAIPSPSFSLEIKQLNSKVLNQ